MCLRPIYIDRGIKGNARTQYWKVMLRQHSIDTPKPKMWSEYPPVNTVCFTRRVSSLATWAGAAGLRHLFKPPTLPSRAALHGMSHFGRAISAPIQLTAGTRNVYSCTEYVAYDPLDCIQFSSSVFKSISSLTGASLLNNAFTDTCVIQCTYLNSICVTYVPSCEIN